MLGDDDFVSRGLSLQIISCRPLAAGDTNTLGVAQKQQESPTSTKEASLQGKTGAISLGAFFGGTQGFQSLCGYQG
jgi:hypothetical protein